MQFMILKLVLNFLINEWKYFKIHLKILGNYLNSKSTTIDPVYKRFKTDPGVGVTKG